MNNKEKPIFLFNPEPDSRGKTSEKLMQEGIDIVEDFERNSLVGGSSYESREIGHDIHVIKVKPCGEEVHINVGPKPKD